MDENNNLQSATEDDRDSDVEDQDDYYFGGYYRLQIGETICNRYTVLRKLGWGNFSTVWLCWDEHDLQSVALKIMKTSLEATTSALREIKILEHIRRCDPDGSHKGKIVHLRDNFELNGTYGPHVCMVFDVLGQDLLKYNINSEDKGLPIASVKRIIRQVLESLDYLHTTCRIIHTDIKPDNILLVKNAREELTVTIADLGNGCWVNRHFSTLIQASAYRCPEVLLEADYGPNADVWSTACMAFDLATGHFLFPIHDEESRKEDLLHMLRILELLGGIPQRKIEKNTLKYFSRKEKLRHYPKMKIRGLIELLTKTHGWNEDEARKFAEFLLPMLAIDPHNRSSAKESLKHQWLKWCSVNLVQMRRVVLIHNLVL